MTTVDDLAAWLAQIWDEDEAIARAATPGPWMWMEVGPPHKTQALVSRHLPNDQMVVPSKTPDIWPSAPDARFMEANDPSKVLARIAADRKILALHRIDVRKIDLPPFDELTGERWADQYDVICRVCGWAAEDPTSACETVRLLALPYADRPGYQEAWKPE